MPRRKRESSWIGREPNGVWYYYWSERVDGGRTRTRRSTLGTRDERKAALRHAEKVKRGEDFGARIDPNTITVSMVLNDYWREHASTLISSRIMGQHIDRLREGLGAWPVTEIGPQQIATYIDNRKKGVVTCNSPWYAGKAVGASTLRNELSALKAAINHAIKWRRLDPGKAPTIPMPEMPAPKPLWLYKDELKQLFNAAEGTIGDFCRIAYYTAARRRSIETLTVFQVSLERGRIALDRPGAVKTKKRRPVVPIAKPLRPVIERCLRETPNEWLLGSAVDRLQQFDRLLKRAGMEMLPERDLRPAGKPTPHTLRHSRATHLLQAGVSPWAVAQLLGDRLETVTRVYGHWCSDHLAEALENIQEIG